MSAKIQFTETSGCGGYPEKGHQLSTEKHGKHVRDHGRLSWCVPVMRCTHADASFRPGSRTQRALPRLTNLFRSP
ncbi:hypothetical protein BaRGS_00018931 [Batillaria attramentaria]|uniref:Uncharacterized protein n=1 Tax=Batillaria attramentaria TaxID=370345 RepID=A0ABD0KSN9_9CAEN